jgi:hypothetical protein
MNLPIEERKYFIDRMILQKEREHEAVEKAKRG